MYMEGLKSCHIETSSFHKSLPKKYFPYLLTKSYYKWGTAPKSRNWTVEIWIRRQKWAWIGHTWRQYSSHGDGVESVRWFRKSSWWTVPDLEKSSWEGDKNAWEKLARAEINCKKPHTMASRHYWCPMSQRGFRTRRRRRSWTCQILGYSLRQASFMENPYLHKT